MLYHILVLYYAGAGLVSTESLHVSKTAGYAHTRMQVR